MELLWIGPDDHERGLELLLNRLETHWSFTACTSFVVMEALGIRDAFAFDGSFVQAAFGGTMSGGLSMLPVGSTPKLGRNAPLQ